MVGENYIVTAVTLTGSEVTHVLDDDTIAAKLRADTSWTLHSESGGDGFPVDAHKEHDLPAVLEHKTLHVDSAASGTLYVLEYTSRQVP